MSKRKGLPLRAFPNLDDVPMSTLDRYIKTLSAAAMKAAGSKKSTLSLAALYARTKKAARKARLAGKINDALRLEDQCETYYRRMPENLRW